MSWENILKAKDDWKKKLKVGTKPKKETMIIEYLKYTGGGVTLGDIKKHLESISSRSIGAKKLRNFLENSNNVQESYTTPKTYSYRE